MPKKIKLSEVASDLNVPVQELISFFAEKGDKKKIRTALNRKLRHSRKQDIADGGAYKKETSWEE